MLRYRRQDKRKHRIVDLVLVIMLIFFSACRLLPTPTQHQIEMIISGYPGAIDLQQTAKAVGSDASIWFTFTTYDSKAQILTYYNQQLRQLGFRDSMLPYILRNDHIDASYAIRDCPMYGVYIAVDETHHKVTAILSTILCR